MADPTNWDGFSGKFFNGSVKLNVDTGIADTAAQHAADVQSAVESVLAKRFVGRISDNKGNNPSNNPGYGYEGFGQLESGKAMAGMFSKLEKDLADALQAQVTILEEMGCAFAYAGKAYQGSEDESRSYFDRLSQGHSDSPYTDKWQAVDQYVGLDTSNNIKTPKIDVWDKNSKNFDNTHKDAPAGDANFKSGYLLTLEAPESIDKPKMEKLGDLLTMDGSGLAEAGALWKAWATFLQGKFSNFEQDIAKIRDTGQWTGQGIDSIVNALNSYMTQVNSLVAAMGMVGDLLVYSGGWISTTAGQAWGALYAHPKDDRKAVEEFRPEYKAAYHYGWQQTFDSLPSIPSPKAMVSPFTPSVPKTDNPNVPGGNNPNGGGNPSSPASPTVPDQPNPDTKQPDSPTNKDQPDTKQPSNDDTLKTIAQEAATTVQTVAQQLSSVVSTGVQGLESIAQQVATTVQQQLSAAQTTKQTEDQQSQLNQQLTNLSSLLNPSGTPTSPGSTPTSSGGTPTSPKSPESPKSQLFPRSTVATGQQEESTSSTSSRAGIATSATSSSGASSMPGMGSMGHAGGAQGGAKEHKRPTYLTSAEHFEEVVGEAPAAVTPVAEK
ncbi:hypothetical protein [Nocardia sp. CDC160]|uniref:hypothetical protein n=1 Tax=Nocardia sp. CDC160 TaxID=3112166 RepID=UPI002DBE41B1|nr:hypothetical protein [Nocardia sp. CDC160]MEC3913296.1 hypothetical protein [Nocardia sp. CDC160]